MISAYSLLMGSKIFIMVLSWERLQVDVGSGRMHIVNLSFNRTNEDLNLLYKAFNSEND